MERAALLALVVAIAGCTTVAPSDVVGSRERVTAPCPVAFGVGGDAAEDAELGVEAGVAHDDRLSIDAGDGLTCGELQRLVARTMARVELLRGLEFRETPRVEIVDRDAFRTGLESRGVPPDRRAVENVRYEALFMIGERTDAVSVTRRNRGASVAAYYAPRQDTVVFPVEDPTTASIDEGVLVHELVHALQDQHFRPVLAGSRTTDRHAARLGLTEGDANYVEYLHGRRCSNGSWAGTCLARSPGEERSGSGSGLANVGPYLLTFQPYSDGPAFVARVRDRRGWAGVNDLYERPPASTEQVIHPARYPEDAPTDVDLPDRSTDAWTRIDPEDAPVADTLGEAGLFSMLLYPSFDSGGEVEVIPRSDFLASDAPRALDPFDYAHPYSAGWDGDALATYRNGADEHAYVWEIAFDSPADAREFLEGYRRLLAYHDARRVGASAAGSTWVIDDGAFADAFRVRHSGAVVRIVNAPSVDDIAAVRDTG